jgi:N-acetylglucosamine transport system permease protein
MRKGLSAAGIWLYVATILVPLIWVLACSFKSGAEIFASPWSMPAKLKWENYSHAWQEAGIGANFATSAWITGISLLILLPIGSMAAYVFARYPFKGSKSLYTVLIAQMLIPNFMVVVPLFLLLKDLSLLDTKTGLILVYVAYSLSFTIFVLTGFFQTLPRELEEAAALDGCSHYSLFYKVMFPLVRPGLIVVGIFNGIGLWNEYQLALVLMTSKENRTLPLGIADLVMTQHYESDWGALFAGLVIVMVPVMVVYWIFRDRIHETMVAGAVKG